MREFDSFVEGWNQDRARALDEARRKRDKYNIPVELVEPSFGRIVELRVVTENEFTSKLYMDQLTDYAMMMELNCGASWSATKNIVKITFADDNMANVARQRWGRQ